MRRLIRGRFAAIRDPQAWVEARLPEWPSVNDIAFAFGVARISVYRWIRRGLLKQARMPASAVRRDPKRYASRPRYIPRAAVVALITQVQATEVPE